MWRRGAGWTGTIFVLWSEIRAEAPLVTLLDPFAAQGTDPMAGGDSAYQGMAAGRADAWVHDRSDRDLGTTNAPGIGQRSRISASLSP